MRSVLWAAHKNGLMALRSHLMPIRAGWQESRFELTEQGCLRMIFENLLGLCNTFLILHKIIF